MMHRVFPVRTLAIVAAASVAVGGVGGWTVNGWRLNGRIAAIERAAAKALSEAVDKARKQERAAAEVTREADAAHAEVQREIEYVTRTIIKEVPVYVTPEADIRFALPAGLVRLHDDAATGHVPELPGAAGGYDADAQAVEPSPVKASQLGATIAENYGQCRADQARLSALQGWVKAQADIASK